MKEATLHRAVQGHEEAKKERWQTLCGRSGLQQKLKDLLNQRLRNLVQIPFRNPQSDGSQMQRRGPLSTLLVYVPFHVLAVVLSVQASVLFQIRVRFLYGMPSLK